MTGTPAQLVLMLARIADADTKLYDVVEHKEKRSLNSNSYYWQLLSKVADKHRISKSALHNNMLRHFGQRMMIDDRCVYVPIPDTEEAENIALESETVHLKPTSSTTVGKDGVTYRYYVMLRGSHEYNSAEMAILISGIVQEAKQVGIETLTPAELAEMQRLEKMAEDRKNDKSR